jgi:hypothetical protein
LPLLVLNLKRAVAGKDVREISAAADAVVASIDTTGLALHLAATKIGARCCLVIVLCCLSVVCCGC